MMLANFSVDIAAAQLFCGVARLKGRGPASAMTGKNRNRPGARGP